MQPLFLFLKKYYLIFTLLLLSFVGMNLIYEFEVVSRTAQRSALVTGEGYHPFADGSPSAALSADIPSIRLRGGLPFEYYFSIQFGDMPPDVSIDWGRFALNVLVWLTFGACVIGYRHYTGKKAGGNKRSRNLVTLDLLMLTVVLASGFAYWMKLNERSTLHERIEEQCYALLPDQSPADRRKIVSFAHIVELPSLVSDYVPELLYPYLRRISEVRIVDPSEQLLREIVDLPYLERLEIRGDKFDSSLLANINPRLVSLLLDNSKIDDSTIEFISSNRSLFALYFIDCDSEVKNVEPLNNLKMLGDLHFIDADCPLEKITDLQVATQLRRLSLPMGKNNEGGNIKLENLDKLTQFQCRGIYRPLNKTPISITLSNLKNLEELILDTFQVFDLSVEQTASLSTITTVSEGNVERVPVGEVTTEFCRMRKLSIRTPIKLESLFIDGREIEQFEIKNNPELIFGIRTTFGNISRNQFGRDFRLSDTTEFPAETRKNWVESYSECSDLETVDLTGCNLTGLDMTPLAKLTSVRQLGLSGTNITQAQIDQLKPLTELEVIYADNNPEVNELNVPVVVETFPNLKTLTFSSQWLNEFRLKNHQNLELISRLGVSDGNFNCRRIHLENLPEFKATVDLAAGSSYIHIENVPKLAGLAINGFIPDQFAWIGDASGLQYFAGGGRNLDDEIFEQVLGCKDLVKLTMAFSGVSPDALKRVDEFKSLRMLTLTGSQVTDDVVASWDLDNLSNLHSLRLENTQITETSLKRLRQLSGLRRLSIRNTNIQNVTAADVEAFPGLVRLDLGKVDVTPTLMKAIGEIENLFLLDLSGTSLDAKREKLLAENINSRLHWLILRNASLDGAELLKRAQKNKQLKFSLTDTKINSTVEDRLARMKRTFDFPNQEELLDSNSWGIVHHTQFGDVELLDGGIGNPSGATNNFRLIRYGDMMPEQFGYYRGSINPYQFSVEPEPREEEEEEQVPLWLRLLGG